jgi:Lactoylglutathione lyase and related lyases
MKLKGIGHVAINVTDFERSAAFYRDTLGLKQLETVQLDGFTITNFELPDGGLLEIMEYGPREGRATQDIAAVGYRHVALLADDLEKWEEYLRREGVPIRMSCCVMENLGIKGLLCEDPDGTEIELYELLKK